MHFGEPGSGESGGCLPKVVDRVPAGTRDLRVEVDIGLVIAGRVLDQDGGPSAGASLRVRHLGMRTGFGDFVASTGPDGSFRIAGLEGGRYELLVPARQEFWERPEPGTPAPARVAEVAAGTGDLVVRVVRGVCIRGRVVEADGSPVNVKENGTPPRLDVTPSVPDPDFPRSFSTCIREDGSFFTDPLDPGKT